MSLPIQPTVSTASVTRKINTAKSIELDALEQAKQTNALFSSTK